MRMKPLKHEKALLSPSRRILRIGILLLAVGLLWWSAENPPGERLALIKLNPALVIRTFTADYLPEVSMGREMTKIAFQNEFSGTEGEVFYVVWQQPDGSELTEKYRITATRDTPSGYCFTADDRFSSLPLPASQFTVYTEQNGEWAAPSL